MSLTKLFNFKYFKENFKKSKSILLLLILILPMFTVLQLMNDTSVDVYTYPLLATINIIGSFIIPFMLSLTLFGYVYKRKSVDFMCSMPVSRKTVYTTNTIGGILVIIFVQLLTLILTMVTSTFIDATVFPELVFDVFLYQTLSYIFVFSISNLAMSFSGNLMTQIAVTILIFAIYPFLSVYINEAGGSYVEFGSYGMSLRREYTNLTLPISTIAFYGNVGAYSIIKTIILSIVYSIMGLFLFTKRKMEKAGESFSYEITHFIVKGLTLIPFVVFVREMLSYSNFSEFCLIGGIILVYWYVYDLITSKKVKLYKSAIALVTSFIILFAFVSIGVAIAENRAENIEIADVDYIILTGDNYYYNTAASYVDGIEVQNLEKTYKIVNKDDIKKIFKLLNEKNKIVDEKVEVLELVETSEGTWEVVENTDAKTTLAETNKLETIYADCTIEAYVSKNEFLRYYTSIEKEELDKILANAEVIEEEWKLVDNVTLGNKFDTITKEEEERIIEILKNVKPYRKRQNQEYIYSNMQNFVILHQYANNIVETCEYRVDATEKLQVLLDEINQRELKYILDKEKDLIGSIEVLFKTKDDFNNKEYYLDYNERITFIEYIEENLLDSKVDYSKDVVSISLRLKRGNDRVITIRTNDCDDVLQELTRLGVEKSYINVEYDY